MRGSALAAAVLALVTTVAIAKPDAPKPPPDITLPRGTRTDANGQLVSSRGLRDTTEMIAKQLDRRGILHRQIGPTRRRGVEITRFVSTTPSTSWLAIHVLRSNGKTLIFFVPRSKALDGTPKSH